MRPALVRWLMVSRGGVRTAWLGVIVGWSVLGGVAVAVLGVSGSSAAVPVGAGVCGVAALSGGLLLAVQGVSEGRRGLFRVLFGVAACLWGIGQLVLGVDLAAGGATFPTVGDAVMVFSAIPALAGLVLMPRRNPEPLHGLRLGLEAVLVGAAAALLVWRLWFRDDIVDAPGAGDVAALALLCVDMSVLALVLICAVRELDRGMLLALAGLALYFGADVATLHAVVQPGAGWPWQSSVLSAVAWPLIVLGVLTVSAALPEVPEEARPRAEFRRGVVTTTTLFVLLTAFLATLLQDPMLDRVSIVLPGIVVVTYAAREVVRSLQNRALLERLVAQAHQDPLTGLGNRRALTEELPRAVRRSPQLSVLTVGIDGFKQVNAAIGHTAASELLQGVSRRLSGVCELHGAHVFRLGGDEFAVLSPQDPQEAEVLGALLVAAVTAAAKDEPSSGAVHLTACVGVTGLGTLRDERSDPLVAIAESGMALRVAKQSGRARVARYTDVVAAAHDRRSVVEGRLRQALHRVEIDVQYQPVVHLGTGALLGFEALARWDDAELGPVSPEEFVPLAEQAGLVIDLGRHVLRRSIAALAETGAAAAGVTIGVNASAIELRAPSYVAEVAALLHRYGVAPGRLMIEVTEGLLVAAADPAVATLRELADLGVVVAIDDFGTGYSSLGYLHRLPVRVLKIDRSLTTELCDPRIRDVVAAVVGVAGALGLDMVVEGVETEEIAAAACALGIRIAQGWLFSRAVPAADLPALLTHRWTVPLPSGTFSI